MEGDTLKTGKNSILTALLVAAVLTVAMTLAGCGSAKTPAKVDSEAPAAEGAATEGGTTEEAPVAQAAPSAIGDKVTSGDWDLVVDKATGVAEVEGDIKAADGNELLKIDITLTNNGTDAGSTGPAYFHLVDSTGGEFQATPTNVQGWIFNMNPIEAGKSAKTTIVYEVPEGKEELTLSFEPWSDKASAPAQVTVR